MCHTTPNAGLRAADILLLVAFIGRPLGHGIFWAAVVSGDGSTAKDGEL